MDRIEMLEKSQQYIEDMAHGINPVTGELPLEDDTINNIAVSRCLFFVNDILKEVLAKESNVIAASKRVPKKKFMYDELLMQQVEITPYPISLTEIVRNILSVYGEEYRLSYKIVAEFLYSKGIFVENPEHSPKFIVNEAFASKGIFTTQRHTYSGYRMVTVFNAEGQRFLFEVLKEM